MPTILFEANLCVCIRKNSVCLCVCVYVHIPLCIRIGVYVLKFVCIRFCMCYKVSNMHSTLVTHSLCVCPQVQVCSNDCQGHQALPPPHTFPASGGLDWPHPTNRGRSSSKALWLSAAMACAAPAGCPVVPAGAHSGHLVAVEESAGLVAQAPVCG